MTDQLLERVLLWIQTWGIWLSWLAWFTVFFGAIAMGWLTRPAWRRPHVRRWMLLVGGLALIANLADYIVTFHVDPQLASELNPIGNMVMLRYGMTAIKIYGLTGKILVSIICGQMAAYYLLYRERLFPRDASTGFFRGLGSRSRTLYERGLALFTLFAFFFAGLGFFYYYVALQNAITDPVWADRLPPIVPVIAVYVALLCVAFLHLTRKAYLRTQPQAPPAATTAQGSEA
jgi:hypothetical protein